MKSINLLLFAAILVLLANSCRKEEALSPVIPGTNSASGAPALTEASATRDDNMGLGNPSGAGSSDKNNYLVSRSQYVLSYNNGRGIANWVSWHLSSAWKGSAVRSNKFVSDASLPSGYFKASTSDYTSTGFDRGHMCPSDDRDGSQADNDATFILTNIIPQAPKLNQQTWQHLEAYCQKLAANGNEMYIIAGSYGKRGVGSVGSAETIASGKMVVPSHCWKVILVLPNGSNDISRITSSTRVIAVDMPNNQSVTDHDWGYYRTSVSEIEKATGYSIFSAIPATVREKLKSKVDNTAI
ncbi:MAG TPA: DNA/RNA non-specific endonuclease [Chitinophaga sp.]|uniref:DNA/RNA non-specific endonuclease n=1 Tax=Chitinophaga sp. TaxID=1869181 RepID=UPI002C6B86AD|nr:DNA/RNA non-specific endonuclease [Chitinophaga sp.]HVI46198.1 DNA/RNA non-specific endonuclease [Chitinophaga sp.]